MALKNFEAKVISCIFCRCYFCCPQLAPLWSPLKLQMLRQAFQLVAVFWLQTLGTRHVSSVHTGDTSVL
jgi:hypothetical protein